MRLDLRTKFLLLFYANWRLLVRHQGASEWVLVATLTLAFGLQGYWRKGLTYAGGFACMLGIDYWLLDSLVGAWASLSSILAVGARFMLPCFMAGSLILSTSPANELISTFRRLHLPEGIIMTLAVMMRYLPTVRYEFRKIRQSLALRGFFPHWWSGLVHPVKYFEYSLMPLILSAGRVAQDLTLATLTKGAGIVGPRSQFHVYRLSWLDYSFLMVLLVQLIAWGGKL